MSQVTLNLPEDVLDRASKLAELSGRPLEEVLEETIELSLRPLGVPSNCSLKDWSDDEVLSETHTELSPQDDAHLSELLEQQQARILGPAERAELASLMESYQSGLLRKAQAIHEAVRRGLREPPKP